MAQIGIYFGTDTGTTRLVAKKLARLLGDAAARPLNVNRTDVDEFLSYETLILGTPTYGIDQLPGRSTNIAAGSWEEFLPEIDVIDFSDKKVALYGLGDQQKYGDRFVDSMIHLYRFFSERGATMIGRWPIDDYDFEKSQSVVDGMFVGLALDQHNQPLLSDERIQQWLDQIRDEMETV